MINLEVGEIVYVLDSNSHSLIPHQIIEKIITKTLSGESIHHVIKNPKSKNFKLEDCSHLWFRNLDEAKIHLLEAATKFVEIAAQKALQIEKVFESPSALKSVDDSNESEYSRIYKEFDGDRLEDSEQ